MIANATYSKIQLALTAQDTIDLMPTEPPNTKKPKKIAKRNLRRAWNAAQASEVTQEHSEVLSIHSHNPGAVLGLTEDDYNGLIKAGELIHDNETKQELLLIAQALVLCGLPYLPERDETTGKPITHYQRSGNTAMGSVTVTIAATNPSIELPYGKDRVVLAWLQTKAKQQKSPTIHWKSAGEFFRAFGLSSSGANYKQFRETWKRLTNAVIRIDIDTDKDNSGQLMPLFNDWYLPTLKDQKTESKGLQTLNGLGYSVTLADALFRHLCKHSVPLRLEIMRLFQNEPKAWDFVAFICYWSWRSENAKSRGRNHVVEISWQDLYKQLGSSDSDERRLRSTLRNVIDKLKTVWPECQATLLRGGKLEVRPPVNAIHPVRD
jgi:hypothetical protein